MNTLIQATASRATFVKVKFALDPRHRYPSSSFPHQCRSVERPNTRRVNPVPHPVAFGSRNTVETHSTKKERPTHPGSVRLHLNAFERFSLSFLSSFHLSLTAFVHYASIAAL
eukprot:TRINITY_DN2708_c0_g1_i1.p1 TRINITY_DN2708_c0_g1~~TRINITY_DN2708_c0_g1_i1.p1  ORF type:complete len:113 (+),score=1.56 TRINITY_DN2708_c0_g1_i1:173-511(+)